MTKKYTTDERVAWVKAAMRNNRKFADDTLKRLYTIHMDAVAHGQDPNGYNGIGYAPFDCDLMCTCAEVLNHDCQLSDKQRKEVVERLPKYAGQVVADIARRNKLECLDKTIAKSLGMDETGNPPSESAQEGGPI